MTLPHVARADGSPKSTGARAGRRTPRARRGAAAPDRPTATPARAVVTLVPSALPAGSDGPSRPEHADEVELEEVP